MTTMPSSRKVARKSVSLAMELGMSKADAARLVQIICDEVTGIIWRQAPDMDITWLANIASEAYLIRQQAGQASAAVAEYSANVARWSREFDQGHSAQRPAQLPG